MACARSPNAPARCGSRSKSRQAPPELAAALGHDAGLGTAARGKAHARSHDHAARPSLEDDVAKVFEREGRRKTSHPRGARPCAPATDPGRGGARSSPPPGRARRGEDRLIGTREEMLPGRAAASQPSPFLPAQASEEEQQRRARTTRMGSDTSRSNSERVDSIRHDEGGSRSIRSRASAARAARAMNRRGAGKVRRSTQRSQSPCEGALGARSSEPACRAVRRHRDADVSRRAAAAGHRTPAGGRGRVQEVAATGGFMPSPIDPPPEATEMQTSTPSSATGCASGTSSAPAPSVGREAGTSARAASACSPCTAKMGPPWLYAGTVGRHGAVSRGPRQPDASSARAARYASHVASGDTTQSSRIARRWPCLALDRATRQSLLVAGGDDQPKTPNASLAPRTIGRHASASATTVIRVVPRGQHQQSERRISSANRSCVARPGSRRDREPQCP